MDEARRVRDFWFGNLPLSAPETRTAHALLVRGRVLADCASGATSDPRTFRRRCSSGRPRGELAGWADGPRRRLSLIILLDQFPRNIYRGTRARLRLRRAGAGADALGHAVGGGCGTGGGRADVLLHAAAARGEQRSAGRVAGRVPAAADRGAAGTARGSSRARCARPRTTARSSSGSAASRIATPRSGAPARRRRKSGCAGATVSVSIPRQGLEMPRTPLERALRLEQLHRQRRAADIHAQIAHQAAGDLQARQRGGGQLQVPASWRAG